MVFRIRPLGAAALFVVTFAMARGTALASTILPTLADSSRGMNIYVIENGVGSNTFAGIIEVMVAADGVSETRDALCIDLFTSISAGVTYDTTVLDPTSIAGKNLTRTAWLINNALLPTYGIDGFTSELPEDYWLESGDSVLGAALQLAIWDITHDGGDGLRSGSVAYYNTPGHQIDKAVRKAANYYLSVSLGKSSDVGYVYDNLIRGTTTEAQMLAGPRYLELEDTEAPEPGTLAVVGAALIGLGCYARRRKSKR